MEALEADDPPSIGGYELRARLGQGGFGLVYLGQSPSGRAMAVKVLKLDLARSEEFLRRFQLEVSAAQRVNGLYTASVVASGLDGRLPWVATAFVPGPTLDQAVVGHGPLPEAALWRLLSGLTEALQDIHACGLVHRDLKPGNVLLATDGPRVIDFGISKALDGTALTSTGAIFGTPTFMAPEQAQAQKVGPATDVFALGCVLAYAATGVPPFGDGTAPSVLYRVVHDAPSIDGLPPLLRDVVARCLAKDPGARPSLADVAVISREGWAGAIAGQSPASFWPPQVARMIRDHQDRLEIAVEGIARCASQPSPHDATDSAVPPSPVQMVPPRPVQPVPPRPVQMVPPRPVQPVPPRPVQPVPLPPVPPVPAKVPWRAIPATVRAAVILMRLAAALTGVYLVAAIFLLVTTAMSVSGSFFPLVLAVAGFWLTLAAGARRGRNWARVTSTLSLGIYALTLPFGYNPLPLLIFGIPVVVLLWLRPSRRYFQSHAKSSGQRPGSNPQSVGYISRG